MAVTECVHVSRTDLYKRLYSRMDLIKENSKTWFVDRHELIYQQAR